MPNQMLGRLHDEFGQSPWLDNLSRPLLADGTIAAFIEAGVRGITSNPTIFQSAIESTDQYDEQYVNLRAQGLSNEDAYWELVKTDVATALDLFKPLYDADQEGDGVVSLEVSPRLAHDTAGTVADALKLRTALNRDNLLIKVPATIEGLVAVQELTARGVSVNVTLIFSLDRYEAVVEAYMRGLEACSGDLSHIYSVASFFISRVDSLVDKQLEALGSPAAEAMMGTTAVAQAVLAYERFNDLFAGPRWEALAARGAKVQRPLWASTSTKNPRYPALLYIDSLTAQNTVNTIPNATLLTLEAGSEFAPSSMNEAGFAAAHETIARVGQLGIDLAKVGDDLEAEGVAKFTASYDELLSALTGKLPR
jgi:transaldolase